MPAIVHEPLYLEIIIWLFPITFMFHALEEIITIENFLRKHKHNVPPTFLGKMTLTIKKKLGATSPQLSISMA
ncbi:hypothetical protein BABA_19351 [Neobacillus bataviensis LMG 21833]|uniref:HXXEE domain-containing protein n=1 Tax=Neobacillus bataviensis LMG 21833 TaxID=1117379 RepID=K6DXP1_9BACI|nr:hypothetical protein BABA_19351 [Neobacillus bataviensis LMG 21833]